MIATSLPISRNAVRREEKGVVLIIGLIMLTMLSMMAAYSIRGSGVSERISANARTQAMAMQAAEAALRWCEKAVENKRFEDAGGAIPVVATDPYTAATVRLAPVAEPGANAYHYADYDNWNSVDATMLARIKVLTFAEVNLNAAVSGTERAMFSRPPECMAQFRQGSGGKGVVITARGFGPDVAAPAANTRPVPGGSEVWLQSFLNFP